jgi:hypothetical protein
MQHILKTLRGTQIAFSVVLLLGLLGMTARNATDPDLWWHLRTGKWIVETGHVPHTDPFSFTQTGKPWVSHEWLTEVVFYELWGYGGAAALIVFSAIITTAGFMLLYLRCLLFVGKNYWAAAATVFGALASAASWGVRPQMFTFTLASLLLWLLEAAEDGPGKARPKLLLWVPLLFLLWLNLHAGFALGPALLLAYGVGVLCETAIGSTPWQEARPILLRLSLLVLACLALVPLNPSGAQLYRYPFNTLLSAAMRSIIGEWFSPNFHEWLYRPFLLVCLLVLIALASSRSRPKGRVIVPLLLTFFAALDAVRHIPIFVLVATPVIAAALPAASTTQTVSEPRSDSRRFRPLFNAAIIVLIAVFALVKWISLARNQNVREAELFPEKAVSFLQNSDLRASDQQQRIFVYYDWGGYAIWKLYPKSRVFVDGRADLYGDDLLRQFKTAIQLRNGWREVLDRWKVEVVLISPSCALAQALLLDSGWHTTFSDSKAIILLRTQSTAENVGISTQSSTKRATK